MPTLLLTRLPGGQALTYPACESAPRCSQALKETDRAKVTYSSSQQNRMAQGLATTAKRRQQPGLCSTELTAQRNQEGQTEGNKHPRHCIMTR